MDYPGMVMKFALLIQAGMTARSAFRKMADDYERRKTKRRHLPMRLWPQPVMKWTAEYQNPRLTDGSGKNADR